MKVRIHDRGIAEGLIDPVTKRSPFVEVTVNPETGEVTKKILDVAEVPETNHWIRRIQSKEIARVVEPTGREPIAPLTTRS